MEIWQTPTLSGGNSNTDKPGNDNDSGSQPSQPNYSTALVSCIAKYAKFNLVNTASGNVDGGSIKDSKISGYINKEVAFLVMILPVGNGQHSWVTELGYGNLLATVDWNQGDGSSSTTIDFCSPEATGYFSCTGKNSSYNDEWRGVLGGMFRGKLSVSTSGRGNTDLKWRAFIFQTDPNSQNFYNQYAMYSQLTDQVTFSPETWTIDVSIQDLSFEIHFESAYSSYGIIRYRDATWNIAANLGDNYVSANFGVLRDYKYNGPIGTVCKYINRELSTSVASINTLNVDSGWQSINTGGQENVKSK